MAPRTAEGANASAWPPVSPRRWLSRQKHRALRALPATTARGNSRRAACRRRSAPARLQLMRTPPDRRRHRNSPRTGSTSTRDRKSRASGARSPASWPAACRDPESLQTRRTSPRSLISCLRRGRCIGRSGVQPGFGASASSVTWSRRALSNRATGCNVLHSATPQSHAQGAAFRMSAHRRPCRARVEPARPHHAYSMREHGSQASGFQQTAPMRKRRPFTR